MPQALSWSEARIHARHYSYNYLLVGNFEVCITPRTRGLPQTHGCGEHSSIILKTDIRDCLNLYYTDLERNCQMDFSLQEVRRSCSYETEEQYKRRQDPQKAQNNINFGAISKPI